MQLQKWIFLTILGLSFSGLAADDYDQRLKDLNKKLNKIEEQKILLKSLSSKKQVATSGKDRDLLRKEITYQHKELRKLHHEYDRERQVLRYKYPEKGAKIGRKYVLEEKSKSKGRGSPEEEQDRMSQIKRKMHRQLGSVPETEKTLLYKKKWQKKQKRKISNVILPNKRPNIYKEKKIILAK